MSVARNRLQQRLDRHRMIVEALRLREMVLLGLGNRRHNPELAVPDTAMMGAEVAKV